MEHKTKALIEVHIAVFLFGVAGLFGKAILLPAVTIVLGRTFFAALALGFFIRLRGKSLLLRNPQHFILLTFLGGVLAFHWYSFFYAIQVSTVAIGLLAFSSFPLFTTFLEPLFFRTRLKYVDIVTASIVMLGLALVVPEFKFENSITQGVIWGILSGLSFAILQILNRQMVEKNSASFVSFYENLGAFLILLCLLWVPTTMSLKEVALLFILGVICTALAHTLFISGLIKIRAQEASVISALEAVYGVILAFLIFDEIPTLQTIIGGTLILTACTIGRFAKDS